MCMILISEVRKRKPEFGWKVIEKHWDSGFVTPYQGMRIEKGKTYHTRYEDEKGIYVFLNKADAVKMKNWIGVRHGRYRFNLARVRLGNHIWKGTVDPHDGFTDLKLEYFYTTNAIEVLDIED